MKIQIKITKEVLRRSMWCGVACVPNSGKCAIAVAVTDILPEAEVFADSIWPFFHGNNDEAGMRHIIALSATAIVFVELFDKLSPEARLNLPEFSFEIEVPDEVIERIGIQQAKDILERSETLNLIEG